MLSCPKGPHTTHQRIGELFDRTDTAAQIAPALQSRQGILPWSLPSPTESTPRVWTKGAMRLFTEAQTLDIRENNPTYSRL